MFHQTFQPRDLLIVAMLVLLEVLLSVDNALVLGMLAGKLPPSLQRKALTYGLIGAFLFRLIAIAGAVALLQWRFIKLLGGGYLIYVALRHLLFDKPQTRKPTEAPAGSFWRTVGAIELTDLAFAADSILAAIALVGPPPPGSTGLHPRPRRRRSRHPPAETIPKIQPLRLPSRLNHRPKNARRLVVQRHRRPSRFPKPLVAGLLVLLGSDGRLPKHRISPPTLTSANHLILIPSPCTRGEG
jgi:hypothetical protein